MPTRSLVDLAKAFFENVTGYNPTTDTFSPSTSADVAGVATTINVGNANQASGVPTPSSFVAISGNGKATASIQIAAGANTLNVALIPQASLDGQNWVNLGPVALLNQNTGVYSSSIAAGASGAWTVSIADFPYFRLSTPSGALTGSAVVLLNASTTQAILAVEPPRYSVQRVTADGLVKTGTGILHTVTIAPNAAAVTAGLLTIYDNTAESGTVIYSEWIPVGVSGHTLVLDEPFTTGLFIGFDATLAAVQVNASYL
jgi:hypothetical protein